MGSVRSILPVLSKEAWALPAFGAGLGWGSEIRRRDWAEMRDNMDGVEWI